MQTLKLLSGALQIAFSAAHSLAVSSGGADGGASCSLIRARRSSDIGWLEISARPLPFSLPVTRSRNSPIGFGERPSLRITSMVVLSAMRSASRECDAWNNSRLAKMIALEPVTSPNRRPIRNDVPPL